MVNRCELRLILRSEDVALTRACDFMMVGSCTGAKVDHRWGHGPFWACTMFSTPLGEPIAVFVVKIRIERIDAFLQSHPRLLSGFVRHA
jgi:hypothetical protein